MSFPRKKYKFDENFAEEIAKALIRSAVSDGHLTPEGKTPEEFRIASLKYIKSFVRASADSDDGIHISTDHRGTLLDRARALKRSKHLEDATLYYATWTEHMLNFLYACSLRRQKLPESQIKECIFGTSIRTKYILLFLNFAKKSAPQIWTNRIKRLCDLRNQFVHFKWSYHPETEGEKISNDYKTVVKDAEKIVLHLKQFEHKYILHNGKGLYTP